MLKEIKEDLSKQKDIIHDRLEDNIVKMTIVTKFIYQFNAIPLKISTTIFAEICKLILKYIWKWKKHRIDKKILKENNKIIGLTLP